MFLKFKHFLNRTFHPKMTSYPPQPSLVTGIFPAARTNTIPSYVRAYAEGVVARSIRAGTEPKDVFREPHIITLFYCKKIGGVQHEYIVVEVHPDGGPPVFLTFERGVRVGASLDDVTKKESDEIRDILEPKKPALDQTVQEAADKSTEPVTTTDEVDKAYGQGAHAPTGTIDLSQYNRSSSSVSLASSLTSVSSSVNMWLLAHDCVATDSTRPKSEEIMLEMNVSSIKLPLLRFAYMAYSINMMQPMYSVLRHQCYWFCALLFTLIFELLNEAERSKVMEKAKDFPARAVLMKAEGHTEFVAYGDAGYWRKVPVVSLREAVLKDARQWSELTWKIALKKMADEYNKVATMEADLAAAKKREADFAAAAAKKEADFAAAAAKKEAELAKLAAAAAKKEAELADLAAAMAKREAEILKWEADHAAAANK